jgi:hypothetical protein
MSRHSVAVAVLAFAALTAGPFAQARKDVPVTSRISDYDTGIAPALQIQSDGAGAYPNSSTLVSVLQDPGAWRLDSLTPRSATRRIYLGFNRAISGSGPAGADPIVPPSGMYKAAVYAKCNGANYGTDMLRLAPGATIPCPLRVEFDVAGQRYWLRMNPFANEEGYFPETNWVDVTCIHPTAGAGPCTQWRIVPNGTHEAGDGTIERRNVAVLLKVTTSKARTTFEKVGDFHVSFLFLVSRP